MLNRFITIKAKTAARRRDFSDFVEKCVESAVTWDYLNVWMGGRISNDLHTMGKRFVLKNSFV